MSAVVSEVQYGRTASVDDIVDACQRNKVILKGIIASPLHSEEGILQTLNMKIRCVSKFIAALSISYYLWTGATLESGFVHASSLKTFLFNTVYLSLSCMIDYFLQSFCSCA